MHADKVKKQVACLGGSTKKKVRKSCETKRQKQYLIPAHGFY